MGWMKHSPYFDMFFGEERCEPEYVPVPVDIKIDIEKVNFVLLPNRNGKRELYLEVKFQDGDIDFIKLTGEHLRELYKCIKELREGEK